ncbi:MAG TPA: translation initiation factor IF-2 [Gemmatimonadales bacterium]|nr:translation initiation factor IF-2 [Gemmatimonadales bacterium]
MTMRVHDLAAELGLTSDELIAVLREMDIAVRSHMSALEEDKVARVRTRVERKRLEERKKRAGSESEAAPRGRRAAGAKTATKSAAKAATTRKKAAKVEEPPAAEEVKPKRRRRTAAEVAAAEAEAAALAAAEAASREPEVTRLFAETEPEEEVPVHRDVDALFPPELAPPVEEEEARRPTELPEPVASATPSTISEPPAERPAASSGIAAPPSGPLRPGFIPRPVERPTPARPRPVASATPGVAGPPRPVASAAPGSALTEERRRGGKGKKGKKGKKGWVDQEAVAENVAKTLATIRGGPVKKLPRRRDDESREQEALRALEEKEKEKTRVHVNEFISVSELAQLLKVAPPQIVTFAFKELGMMVTVNQRLDFDQIELICSAFGFQAVREEEYVADVAEAEAEDKSEDLVPRPPVVTIMGHVDHGKTSLLDYIRKTNVVAGESGGITQHIGAYNVELADGRRITFLDTPGHEAFTAMRARGAQVTDIVVLVVAADDAIMPQTVEAISHARNAGVPIVVAINKIDLPTANVMKVKQDLLQHQVVLEEFGGTTLATPISAKTGQNVPQLLEQILLQAELLELKANPKRAATGTVLEAQLDPGKGPVATILVTNGTLNVGDNFICGMYAGRVRALQDERGRPVKSAGPSTPVQVLGFEGVPQAGDSFTVVADAVQARDIAQRRQRLEREAQSRRTSRAGVSLEEFFAQRKEGEVAALRLIIKADQGGPAEALADALSQLSNPEVRVEVVHRGVGAIGRNDVLLAKASGAIIIGFHVRPDSDARTSAAREHVDIRLYKVIYEAVEDVKAALEGMLKPEEKEVVLGEAEVRQLFKISGVGVVAGSYVRSGVIQRTAKARVIRDGVVVYDGNLASLRRFKDDVKEVKDGLECGIGIENFNDLKVGDLIESYRVEQVARTLETTAQARGE